MASIILGGVTLSSDMVWEDEFGSQQSVAQTAKRTLGGMPIVLYQQMTKGRPITLTAVAGQGWLTHSQVSAVQQLATNAGSVLTLSIGTNTFNVMFRHEDPPAFIATALDQVGALAPDTGYYLATIKLMTV